MESLRTQKLKRHAALVQERTSWMNRYRDLSEFILPFSGRFVSTDRNRGDKSFNSIYDSTGTRALRILAAGMMAGMTSPARPWFRLATPDNELMEVESVKLWLNAVSQLMRDIFARSNTYRALHSMYEELGCFATTANLIEDDFDTVLWNYPLTAGEYCIAVNHKGRPDSLDREFEITVAQLVEKFVYDKNTQKFDWTVASHAVKNLYDGGRFDQWVPILHAIAPRTSQMRDAYKGDKRSNKNMPFSSCYFEMGGNEDKVLRESGFDEFPGTVARWHTRGGDIYGNGPGMEALGDIKQLQHEQFRKAQGIDFMVKPPVILPPGMKGHEVEYLPGGVMHGDGAPQSRGHNLMDVRIDLQHLLADIVDVRGRVNQAFYADLFLAITNMPGIQPRNVHEIAERHEEKLLMLGPVLERLHDEMLSPKIDIAFAKIIKADLLRNLPPPPEMDGMDLKVEFVSTLAQAQKAVGLGSLDRIIGTVALISQGRGEPSAWDKLDTDQIIDKYSDMLAIDPSCIVSDKKIAFIRKSRQEAQAAQQVLAMAKPASDMANAAATISEVDPDAANDVTRSLMGYT